MAIQHGKTIYLARCKSIQLFYDHGTKVVYWISEIFLEQPFLLSQVVKGCNSKIRKFYGLFAMHTTNPHSA